MLRLCLWGRLMPLVVLIILPTSGAARENMLSGSLAVRQEYDSNVYLTDTAPQEAWYTIVSPGFLFTSSGPTNQLDIAYNPGIRRNLTTDETTLDHDFFLRANANLSSLWQVGLLNRFHLSDHPGYDSTLFSTDPNYDGRPGVETIQSLSDRRARERFQINTFSLFGDYLFAEDSTLALGYENRILNSKTEGQDDYVRHNPRLAVGYQLNQQWRTEAGYGYIRGDFDLSDDLDTHTGDLGLIFQLTQHDQLSTKYNINQTSYQGLTPDYLMHIISGGWKRDLSQHMTLTTSIGLTAIKRENQDAQNVFTYAADLSRQLERLNISIGGRGGIDEMQFNGDGNGLSKYWQLHGSGSYQLLERLRSNLGLSMRNNDFIDQTPPSQEKIYLASCGLSYSFLRFYEMSVRYRYKELKDDGATGGYQDHSVLLELKATHNLWQW